MQSVLVTGASGYIGTNLVNRLMHEGHHVIALSRKRIEAPGLTMIEGSYTDTETVSALSRFKIDSVIHLGGVTGEANEKDAMQVNVAGSSILFRNLIDQGIRKFIVASSIAVVGCLTSDFIPRKLPIPDNHPCDSTNIYGVSKYFIEELCEYYSRLVPDLDITLFRIGAVLDDAVQPSTSSQIGEMTIPFCTLGTVSLGEVVEALILATSNLLGSGTRIMNLVSQRIHSEIPTIEALQLCLGDRFKELDTAHFRIPGNEFDALYDTSVFKKLLPTAANKS
jgi:nucleoside-diphosphate-sugar epimerase